MVCIYIYTHKHIMYTLLYIYILWLLNINKKYKDSTYNPLNYWNSVLNIVAFICILFVNI